MFIVYKFATQAHFIRKKMIEKKTFLTITIQTK